MNLKEKLKQQRQHLDELEKHMYATRSLGSYPSEHVTDGSYSDEVTKEQGGEHN